MRLYAVLLMLLLALAGCTDDSGDGDGADGSDGDDGTDGGDGNDGGDGSDGGADGGDGTESNETQRRDPVTWDIDVGDNTFDPSSLTIQVGDTVRWTQSGSNPHTVTEDDDAFDSHPDCSGFQDSVLGNCMAEGDTFEYTFETSGDFGYYCKIHGSPGSGMAGSIEVLDRFDDTPDA